MRQRRGVLVPIIVFAGGHTVNPRFSPPAFIYFLEFCIEAYSKGGLFEGLKIFPGS